MIASNVLRIAGCTSDTSLQIGGPCLKSLFSSSGEWARAGTLSRLDSGLAGLVKT